MNPDHQEFQLGIFPTPINIAHTKLVLKPNNSNGINVNTSQFNLIGSGITGPDVLTRLTFSLKSGIDSEIKWALNTLVQLSNSNPALVSLKQNPFFINELQKYLVKPLIILSQKNLNLVMEASNDTVKEEADENENMEGLILHNSEDFDKYLNFSLDAILTLRNLSQDIVNTQILSQVANLKNILLKILNNKIINQQILNSFNKFQQLKELFNYTIDLIESLSSFYSPAPKDDVLFLTLMKILIITKDKSTVISILRSLSRLMVRSNLTEPSCSENITQTLLDQIVSYLLINDEDLLVTTVDFIHQYCLPGGIRISNLIKNKTRLIILRTQLPKLLLFGLDVPTKQSKYLRLIRRAKPPIPSTIPQLTPELFNIISDLQEPLRATTWMRCVYESQYDGEVTQISLWKSYEKQFEKIINQGKRLLPAVDFIKNVNQAFPHSSAMVVNLPDGSRKFIIKGIQPRQFVVDIDLAHYEASKPLPNPNNLNNSINHDLPPQQEPLPLPQSPVKDVDEFNKSVCSLLNLLTTNKAVVDDFKVVEQELFTGTEACPALFDHLSQTLDALDSYRADL